VDVKFEMGVQWVEVLPSSAPTETWFTTTVFYDFTIQFEDDITLFALPGAKAQFTVRNTGTEEAPQWRLVEWRDIGAGVMTFAAQPTSVEESTWGKVKALYR
jgi:hypothetical protein